MDGMEGGIRPVRRIVTGLDGEGRSTVVADGPCAAVAALAGTDDFGVTDVWALAQVPARLDGPAETTALPIALAPPAGGAVLRVVQFPPDRSYLGKWDARRGFASMGPSGAAAVSGGGPHEAMHRTRSVDFAIVVEGEIWSVLDADERPMRAGDVLVQRGTNHAWSNRSDRHAVVAFVLVDALEPAGAGGGEA